MNQERAFVVLVFHRFCARGRHGDDHRGTVSEDGKSGNSAIGKSGAASDASRAGASIAASPRAVQQMQAVRRSAVACIADRTVSAMTTLAITYSLHRMAICRPMSGAECRVPSSSVTATSSATRSPSTHVPTSPSMTAASESGARAEAS